MRWMLSVSPLQGNGRAAEIVRPAGSSATVIESAATPGSATCTCRCSAVSVMSAGGSHDAAAWWKNWRCRRSARSSIDRASLHIQLEISRDLTAARWRQKRPVQARCKKRSKTRETGSDPCANRLFLLGLLQQPLAERDHRGALGNDLRTYKVIGRLRLELDLERRAKAPRGEIRIDQRTQRKRDAELLRGGFEREDVGREMWSASAVDLVGDPRQLEPLLPGVAVRDEVHRIVVQQ